MTTEVHHQPAGDEDHLGRRASGVLLHPTSLPGAYGIGDLGPEAYRFADWLAAAGQRLWQVLPLGPVGYGESPYQLFSAFAGNHLLISLEQLVERGLLTPADIANAPRFPANRVDFERVIPWKMKLLRRAFERSGGKDCSGLDEFARTNSHWLENYARFMALKQANGGVMWTEWQSGVAADERETDFHRWAQCEFFREWFALKSYCGARGIRIMGDLPIYVARDSTDVWANPEYFREDALAGVPPDYFSATGQLWGNPLYRWDRLEAEGYQWWVARMQAALQLFDVVRMDHFRGFEAYWSVPAGETTAETGQWIRGPGTSLFHALQAALGRLPIVAENLGVITPEVEAIRKEFGLPGMAVLQFAFGNDPQARDFRPHNYPRNLVAYTGTHDNDTVMGWWCGAGGASTRSAEDVAEEKARARAYLHTDGGEMNWVMIRALLASVADTVLFPVQDILGLGNEGRMNTPGVAGGNWRWRIRGGVLDQPLAERLRELVILYER